MKLCGLSGMADSDGKETDKVNVHSHEIIVKTEVLEIPWEDVERSCGNEECKIEVYGDPVMADSSPSSPSPKRSRQIRYKSSKSTRKCKKKTSVSQSSEQNSKQELSSYPLPDKSEVDDPSKNEGDLKINGEESMGMDDEGQQRGHEDKEEETQNDKHVSEDWKQLWGIRCNECSQIFSNKMDFDKHYIGSYAKKPLYTCSSCNKATTKYTTFRSHRYRHVNDGRYQCEYCKRGFYMKNMLESHIMAKHKNIKPFICEECGKGFSTRTGVTVHLQRHNSNEKAEYPCSVCGKILHSRGGMAAHMNLHNPTVQYMCDVCGKTFAQKVNMLQHVKLHSGERPFPCEKCGKCFAQKAHVIRHYSFHSEMRPFQCTVCLKKYKTERCLKVHEKVHSDTRPHSCEYCGKGFLSTSDLKQHINIHTGARPFACKFCERTFTNYPNWLKHSRRLHNADPKSGVEPIRLTTASGLGHLTQWEELQQKETVTVTPEIPEDVETASVKSETSDSASEKESLQ